MPSPALEWRAGYLRALSAGTATVLWCPLGPTPAAVPVDPVRQIEVVVQKRPSA